MFDKYFDLINEKLKNICSLYPNNVLKEAVSYSLLSGGKRLRPLLLLLLLDDLNIDLNKGINQACAVEMIHAYSLIHDDLPAMDNDDYRRGKLTNHKVFGEAIAILAGDALLTDSFNMFLEGDLTYKQKYDIVKLASFYSGSNGMVNGQVLDITLSNKEVTLDQVHEIHLHKTKDLINLAISIGGIIADLDEETRKTLDDFSYYFGLCFQIKDDIKDIESTTIELGKDANSDLKNDKATYPKILGLEDSKKILNSYKVKALEIIEKLVGKKQLYALTERIL